MSRYIVVSDIHGNYPSIEAVVEREGYDSNYIVLGDVHGLNAYPKETLEIIRDVGTYVLSGNHDKAIFEKREGHVNSDKLSVFEINHTRSSLTEEEIRWMSDLPF